MPGYRLPSLQDDGIACLEVGPWAELKYRLVGLYASLFSTSMKGRWDHRVYIDLFAGPGRSRIRDTSRIVPASPSIAMSLADPFTRYIFSEKDDDHLACLRERWSLHYSELDVQFVSGDCNVNVEEILARIPAHGPSSKVLSFCFVDPFRLANLKFETIKALSTRFVDFLILIPTGMDAARNLIQQLRDEDPTATDGFVGTSAWKAAWEARTDHSMSPEAFFTDYFSARMKGLGYEYGGVDNTVLIRNPDRNQRLYRLGFYSTDRLGEKLWREAKKYSVDQQELEFQE